jgi:hypothetical protein
MAPRSVAPAANAANIVDPGITGSIHRWIHIVSSIPILVCIYSLLEKLPDYAPATRFVLLPAMFVSGFRKWKGHVLRRHYFEKIGLTGRCSETLPA